MKNQTIVKIIKTIQNKQKRKINQKVSYKYQINTRYMKISLLISTIADKNALLQYITQ